MVIMFLFSRLRIIPALAGNTSKMTVKSVWRRDHPRSRGEYGSGARHCSSLRGSSPLSRGILPDRVDQVPYRGIIPALAGNTGSVAPRLCPGPDHPRSRGEYGEPVGEFAFGEGSSPLSRGIPGAAGGHAGQAGIIPALAGNTPNHDPHLPAPSDHPRSRGEYAGPEVQEAADMGSSPLSRGIPFPTVRRSGLVRIIPALAGNTRRGATPAPRRTDHPRSRGEYVPNGQHALPHGGSSPLSRGIRGLWDLLHECERIIPALAGNTCSLKASGPISPDHPRSRGEYRVWVTPSDTVEGSSPLSRGIHPRSPRLLPRGRIIPALAGNTHAGCRRRGRYWDHPRSRGEYALP